MVPQTAVPLKATSRVLKVASKLQPTVLVPPLVVMLTERVMLLPKNTNHAMISDMEDAAEAMEDLVSEAHATADLGKSLLF